VCRVARKADAMLHSTHTEQQAAEQGGAVVMWNERGGAREEQTPNGEQSSHEQRAAAMVDARETSGEARRHKQTRTADIYASGGRDEVKRCDDVCVHGHRTRIFCRAFARCAKRTIRVIFLKRTVCKRARSYTHPHPKSARPCSGGAAPRCLREW
jgi:hypothetical protein